MWKDLLVGVNLLPHQLGMETHQKLSIRLKCTQKKGSNNDVYKEILVEIGFENSTPSYEERKIGEGANQDGGKET